MAGLRVVDLDPMIDIKDTDYFVIDTTTGTYKIQLTKIKEYLDIHGQLTELTKLIPEIVNDVTSGGASKLLSAEQGKFLGLRLKTMEDDIEICKVDNDNVLHDTLKERLDTDYETIMEEFNKENYVQYEGPDLLIENTYSGVTKDLIIEGRTVGNIVGNVRKSRETDMSAFISCSHTHDSYEVIIPNRDKTSDTGEESFEKGANYIMVNCKSVDNTNTYKYISFYLNEKKILKGRTYTVFYEIFSNCFDPSTLAVRILTGGYTDSIYQGDPKKLMTVRTEGSATKDYIMGTTFQAERDGTPNKRQVLYFGFNGSNTWKAGDKLAIFNPVILEGDWITNDRWKTIIPHENCSNVVDADGPTITIQSQNSNLYQMAHKWTFETPNDFCRIVQHDYERTETISNSSNWSLAFNYNKLPLYMPMTCTGYLYRSFFWHLVGVAKTYNAATQQTAVSAADRDTAKNWYFNTSSFAWNTTRFSSEGSVGRNYIRNVAINAGWGSKGYEIPNNTELKIPLPVIEGAGLDGGLRSLPNGVCDKIYVRDGKVYHEQNVGVYYVTADRIGITGQVQYHSNWQADGTIRYFIEIPDMKSPIRNMTHLNPPEDYNIYSPAFPSVWDGQITDPQFDMYGNGEGTHPSWAGRNTILPRNDAVRKYIYITFSDVGCQAYDSTINIKAALEANNLGAAHEHVKKYLNRIPNRAIEINYELSAPVLREINMDAKLLLPTHNGFTRINFMTPQNGNIKVKVPTNITATVNTLSEQTAKLRSVNSMLIQDYKTNSETLLVRDAELALEMLNQDLSISEIEEAINMGKERIIRAQSPYQLLEIVIRGQRYDEEDIKYKAKRYLAMKRLTQDEYNDILNLMVQYPPM